jgi:hypothetical protein
MISPDDLDAAWFQTVLAPRYPGVQVADAEVTGVDEMTNTHVRVSLTHDHAAGAPARVFVKLPPFDPRRRALLGASGMGANEARFYERLAPALDLRVPTSHAALVEDDGGFVMVLEDLADSGCAPYDGITGVAPDAAAVALEDLAGMHVRFEDPTDRTGAEVSWIAPPAPPSDQGLDLGARLLQRGIDEHRDRLGDAYVAVAERYIADPLSVRDLWVDAPPTVIHGDLHLGNLFSDHGRVGFLDWGLVTLADPLRDVSYFLVLALDIEVRRRHERELLQHYLDVRHALGGREIGWDEAWMRHRIQSAYTVLASCQAIRVPKDADDRTRAFADAFLARPVAAVDDLDAPTAIGAS